MPLVKLDIPAGVYSHGVDLDSKGRWLDSSLVRWTNNAPQPVGGWIDVTNIETITSDPDLEDVTAQWTLDAYSTYDANLDAVTLKKQTSGTSSGYITQDLTGKLQASTTYIVELHVLDWTENQLLNVVLAGGSETLDETEVVNGVATVEITTPELAYFNDFDITVRLVSYNVLTGFPITLSAIYVRQKDRQSRGSHAWSTLTGAPYFAAGSYNRLAAIDGNSVIYDITPTSGFSSGIAAATENLGYGGKNYGADTYGTPRTQNYSLSPATNWSLDNWGEDLVACSDYDGHILLWDVSSPSTPASIVSGAPVSNDSIVVTAERFLFALGAAGNNRKVQWCDREDLTTWTPAVTNEAGDIDLQTSGAIVAGARVRGRTLILTTVDAWVATYQGPPTVYGFQKIGNSCGLVGRNMLASVGPTAFWMGERNFFVYDGSTARVLPCEVHDKVFTEMNKDRISHGFCVSNQKFNEVWWFYPGSAATENTRYVAYDYHENHWLVGELNRTTGSDLGAFSDPLWIDDSGTIHRHETGYGHNGNAVFLESGPINIADGDNVVRITEMIPEEETQGDVSMTFKTRFYPNGAESSHGPYNPANPTSVRMTGRQFRVRVDGDDETDWRLGDIRLRMSNGGRR